MATLIFFVFCRCWFTGGCEFVWDFDWKKWWKNLAVTDKGRNFALAFEKAVIRRRPGRSGRAATKFWTKSLREWKKRCNFATLFPESPREREHWNYYNRQEVVQEKGHVKHDCHSVNSAIAQHSGQGVEMEAFPSRHRKNKEKIQTTKSLILAQDER